MTRVIGLLAFEFEMGDDAEDYNARDVKVRKLQDGLDEHGRQIVKGFRVLGPPSHQVQRSRVVEKAEPSGDPEALFEAGGNDDNGN